VLRQHVERHAAAPPVQFCGHRLTAARTPFLEPVDGCSACSSILFDRPILCINLDDPFGSPICTTRSTSPQSMPVIERSYTPRPAFRGHRPDLRLLLHVERAMVQGDR
jgi:hypothetical protein